MAVPTFKFTIYNDGLYPNGIVLQNNDRLFHPVAWKDSSLKLDRHKDYHSLVEYFESGFIWFGQARDIIREIEDDQGIDAKIRLVVEIMYKHSWDLLFDGQIDISQIEDIAKADKFYKTQAPIIRDGFWSKFINRNKTLVDVGGSVDVDGNPVTPIAPITLPFPSQKLREIYRKKTDVVYTEGFPLSVPYLDSFSVSDGTSRGPYYLQMNTYVDDISEIEEKFTYDNSVSLGNPLDNLFYIFKVKYGGTYRMSTNIKYRIRVVGSSGAIVTGDLKVKWLYATKTNGVLNTPIEIGEDIFENVRLDNVETGGIDVYGNKELLEVILNLIPGDEIYIYGEFRITGIDVSSSSTLNIGTSISTDYASDKQTALQLIGDTVYEDTSTDAFLIKDSAESILSKITGTDNVIQSNLFASCTGLYALMRGLHVRGYSLTDKQLFMSFDDWWNGANPLLALGLGYIEGQNRIEIEHISEFYDPVPVVNFSNVPDLERSYDLEKHYKTIEIGFNKWSAESDSGMDDPQTKKSYHTRFSNFGKDEKILSKFYMASLGIERSRRNRVEIGKDDRLDEDIIAIRLKETETGYTPEVGDDLESTSNILNPDERYNLRDTPATMFKRWQSYLQGCLQHYPADQFKFSSAEGNYDAAKEFKSDDCEFPSLSLSEKQNIDVTDEALFIPKVYKCSVPMSYETYKLIRANRKKAVGVSRTDSNHVPMFIMSLDFKIMSGSAELTLMLGTNVNV